MDVKFSAPPNCSRSLANVEKALQSGHLSGGGPFGKACENLLTQQMGVAATFLTPSCTAALEMASLVCNIGPGDEVIMPSFTFTSTATAVAIFGATPVFVDIDPETLNIDPAAIAPAIGPKTKAIVVMHYAGVACDMDPIMKLALEHKLDVIEDAAQCIGARYKNRHLGTIGRCGAMSFHETKNLGCGEGGAIFLRDTADVTRAEILRDKGSNRRNFLRGLVDKYSWVDKGSSYLLGEIPAAVLHAQLEEMEAINSRRRKIWDFYHRAIASSPTLGRMLSPQHIPDYAQHNAHIYFVIFSDQALRSRVLGALRERRVFATSHYEPLHTSIAGRKLGRTSGLLPNSQSLPGRLLRLPLYSDLTLAEAEHVITVLEDILRHA